MLSAKRTQSQILSQIATGRTTSLFAFDWESRKAELRARIGGSRILVIGGAGSIGSATIRALAPFAPRALHVVDIAENNLAELVRDLRGSCAIFPVTDFRCLPVDYGSEVFHRFLLTQEPYDAVLNFAALKHVRSEKDICSLLQMIDTNILKQARLLQWLHEIHQDARYFSVSTDKAANATNLMGATKRFMEHVMFSRLSAAERNRCVTSARFANVAVSDGSLLYGWSQRLAKGQPLAVPVATKRYFFSLEEAGQICLLAGILGADAQIFIPKLNPADDLKDLASVAFQFLTSQGLHPREYYDEAVAKARVSSDLDTGRYPILFTLLDTSGEKSYEEFVGDGERPVEIGFERLLAVEYLSAPTGTIERFLKLAEEAVAKADSQMTKADIVAALEATIPQFRHAETGKSLDDRL